MGNCDSDKDNKSDNCAEDKAKKVVSRGDESATASDAKGAEESDMDKGAANVSSSLEDKDMKK